jgi:SAM-dependent methyltransferase
MSSWQQVYIDKYYSRAPQWKDIHAIWNELLQDHVPRGARALEIGPGPANDASVFLRDRVNSLVGLDVERDPIGNEWIDELHLYDGNRFPFPDHHFDVVASRWVNEHLPDPVSHCREVFRVLAPGGKYVFRTPNLLHYMASVSRITPHWFHVLAANRLRNYPVDHHEPWPTHYRFNTRRRISSTLRGIGFEIDVLNVTETFPVYGQISRALFFVFLLYERVVNATPLLEDFRYVIDCVARKAATSQANAPT